MWTESELLTFCEKLIAKKKYIIAEEFLWEAAKRNRLNPVAPALLGRIFEETKQFATAAKLYDTSLLLLEDGDVRARRERCSTRHDVLGARQEYAAMARDALEFASPAHSNRGAMLHETRCLLTIAQLQLTALQEQVWPNIAADADSWTVSDEDIRALSMDGAVEFCFIEGHGPVMTRRREFPNIYTDNQIDFFLSMIEEKKPFFYGDLDDEVFRALADFPMAGQDCAVIGSLSPWYESICIANGGHPTTVEYRAIDCKTSRIAYMHVDDFYGAENRFDCAISLSSVEHDGLGGYNVPISPDADLLAMKKLSQAVKPGGLVFFNVPIGKDMVRYPELRRYGRARFPKLIEGWEIVQTYGFRDQMFDRDEMSNPLFILKNLK